jgi:hypothetical protein
MTKINMENVRQLVAKAYLAHARAAFGDAGAQGIISLLDGVKLIFQRCPAERVPGTLTVLLGIGATPLAPAIQALGTPRLETDYAEVGKFILASTAGTHAVVEIASDGKFHLLALAIDPDLKALAQNALVYRFDGSAERILAKDHEDFVPSVSPLLKSNFSVPTITSLEDAFEFYRGYVLESKCRVLKEVWEGGVDGPRLVLVNRPEARMRDSLTQALEILLRDATVKPEQNTDETKPVDIRVNWFASGAIALIEVKWLGRASAKPGPPPTYTEYTASRAQAGASQLADYMDREVRHSDATAPRGYLVVFDARRKGTKGPADQLPKADAMAFANEVLAFDPDHAKIRADFAKPVRFFLKPRESLFLAA